MDVVIYTKRVLLTLEIFAKKHRVSQPLISYGLAGQTSSELSRRGNVIFECELVQRSDFTCLYWLQYAITINTYLFRLVFQEVFFIELDPERVFNILRLWRDACCGTFVFNTSKCMDFSIGPKYCLYTIDTSSIFVERTSRRVPECIQVRQRAWKWPEHWWL